MFHFGKPINANLMQLPIIDEGFSADYDFVASEGNSMAAPKPKANGVSISWVITTGLLIIGMVVGSTVWLSGRFETIEKHLTRVETAERIISTKLGGDTKQLVDEALKVAAAKAKSGDQASAKHVLDTTSSLIEEQAKNKVPAPSEMFRDVVFRIQQLERVSPALTSSSIQTLQALAAYRTLLNSIPPELLKLRPAVRGAYLGRSRGLGAGMGSEVTDSYFRSIDLSSVSVPFDGSIFKNVVFEDVTIVYHGGPVTLENVTFINCRFIVPSNLRGQRLLEVAALDEKNLAIG